METPLNLTALECKTETAPCRFCGDPDIGVIRPSYLMIHGHYAQAPALGYEVFVLNPRQKVKLIELPNGMQALVADIDPKQELSCVAHEECMINALNALYTLGDLNEEHLSPDILREGEWGRPVYHPFTDPSEIEALPTKKR